MIMPNCLQNKQLQLRAPSCACYAAGTAMFFFHPYISNIDENIQFISKPTSRRCSAHNMFHNCSGSRNDGPSTSTSLSEYIPGVSERTSSPESESPPSVCVECTV